MPTLRSRPMHDWPADSPTLTLRTVQVPHVPMREPCQCQLLVAVKYKLSNGSLSTTILLYHTSLVLYKHTTTFNFCSLPLAFDCHFAKYAFVPQFQPRQKCTIDALK